MECLILHSQICEETLLRYVVENTIKTLAKEQLR
jgi:hypothetical protein